jgi:hypothetical protein
LRSLFEEEHTGIVSITTDLQCPTPAGPVDCQLRISLDPALNIKVPRFYVPRTLEFMKVLLQISKDYARLMEEPFAKTRYMVRAVGQTEDVAERAMKFSGRVFVYHENSLTIQQAAEVDRAFSETGAKVELRSSDYQWARYLAKKSKELDRPSGPD